MSQRLTPVDILNLRFNRRVSGYAIAEVDDFVRRVAADMEAALADSAALKERLLSLERELAQYREIESTLRDALVLAQKAADDARTTARQQADLLLHEAQSRVREMDAQAHRRLSETDQRIERLQQERRRIVRDMRSRLTAQLAWLDEEMEPADNTQAGEAAVTPRTDLPVSNQMSSGRNAASLAPAGDAPPIAVPSAATDIPGRAMETTEIATMETR
jgi:cell division initiation protein